MPNGDGTKKGKKSLGLISKTQLCSCIALFIHIFFLSSFSRLQTSQLLFLWRKCHMCSQKILLRVCVPFFFTAAHFHPAGCQLFTFSYPAVTKISYCSCNEIRLLLFIFRFSSFSVIHVGIDIKKIQSNKDSAFLSFLSLKVRQNVLVVE